MRTVEFPSGTHQTTQRGVSAVLRALDRRGVRAWRGPNVTRELTDYIAQSGDSLELDSIGYALRWLEQQGYAQRELSDSGRHTLAFTLADDVEPRVGSLNGSRGSSWDRYRDVTRTVPTPVVPHAPQLPLPYETQQLYRLDELTLALRDWAETDREAYATWVDQVLDQLRGATHG